MNAKKVDQINELVRDTTFAARPDEVFVKAGWRDATNLHMLYDMRFPLPTPVKIADLTVVLIQG
jgi:hypothetical protein